MVLRALLVCDRRFLEMDGGIYTEGAIGSETGLSLLNWFDTVTIAGRRGQPKNVRTGCLNRVDTEGIVVAYLPDISGLLCRSRNLTAARGMLSGLISAADAVIVRMPTELGLEAGRMAIAAGKLLAVDVGGCVFDGMCTHGSLAGRIYAPIAFWRMRALVRKAFWVAYVTQHFLQKRYPSGAGAQTVACTDVNVPDVSPAILERRLARIDAEPRPLTFGTIGSLHGRFKGIQDALAALALASPHLPPFRYRILGGGETGMWQGLVAKNRLSKQVFFDGTCPSGEPVHRWLDGIDIYLQPSLREGLPRALIEAMSRACPAVASNVAGIPEILPTEVLHDPGDVRRLAALIEQSFARTVMVSRARQNWTRAQDFARWRVDSIRGAFWSTFLDKVMAAKRGS